MFTGFKEVWVVDLSSLPTPSEHPIPVCMVAKDIISGRTIKLWANEMGASPPYDLGNNSLFVAFANPAEFSCHLALGWPLPARTIDLHTKFRAYTNGIGGNKANLLWALAHFNLDSIGAEEKASMIDRVLAGPPYSDAERRDILDYCEGDVLAAERLLKKMWDAIDLPRALLRGRYACAVARMICEGVPFDAGEASRIFLAWDRIKERLVADIDSDYGVFDGVTFKRQWFERYLAKTGTPWPRLPSGALDLNKDTFRQMATAHPHISPLRELRSALGQMRQLKLAAGRDGRTRPHLFPFASRTGRNQPSNSEYIFGTSVWLRCLIKPAPGKPSPTLTGASRSTG